MQTRKESRSHCGRRSRVLWLQAELAHYRAPTVWLGLQRNKVPLTTGGAEATLHTACGNGSGTGKDLGLHTWPGLMCKSG